MLAIGESTNIITKLTYLSQHIYYQKHTKLHFFQNHHSQPIGINNMEFKIRLICKKKV